MSSKLCVPRGFRDILPAEARLREAITNRVQAVFDLWGYDPVETPTLEYADILQGEGGIESSSFRLLDSEGALLCLRPDVTLPLARLVAMRLAPFSEPLRLRYRQTVFREEAALRGQSRSFTQLGVEYIGESGILADAEVLLLLGESLEAAGVEGFTIAFCDVSILQALLSASIQNGGGTPDWAKRVLAACHRNDFVEVDKLAAVSGLNKDFGQALSVFVRSDGGSELVDELRGLLSPLIAPADSRVLDDLEATARLVEDLGPRGVYRIDSSVMSAFSYYTGLVAAAYAPGVGTPLARGGRYDSTLAAFGPAAPAAGFALDLERIVAQVMQAKHGSAGQSPYAWVTELAGQSEAHIIRADGLDGQSAAELGFSPGKPGKAAAAAAPDVAEVAAAAAPDVAEAATAAAPDVADSIREAFGLAQERRQKGQRVIVRGAQNVRGAAQ